MEASHFDGGAKKKQLVWEMKSRLVLCLGCGWVVGWVLPSHGGCRLWEYQEKQWVAIGFPLRAGLAVPGWCPSFALPLSRARHTVRTDFIC